MARLFLLAPYGEGADRAFLRLLEEIMKTAPSGAMDLFNWAGEGSSSKFTTSLLPLSPRYYLHRSTKVLLHCITNADPLVLTPKGIQIPVIIMPGLPIDPCHYSQYNMIGNYGATVDVSWPMGNSTYWLLHEVISDARPQPEIIRNGPHLTFAVFNIRPCVCLEPENYGTPAISLATTCVAIILQCIDSTGRVSGGRGKLSKMPTIEPVVFELQFNRHKVLTHSNIYRKAGVIDPDFLILEDDVESHGMQLVSDKFKWKPKTPLHAPLPLPPDSGAPHESWSTQFKSFEAATAGLEFKSESL
ncbi:hypothetical protein BDN70DRAFT_938098 [Pholiota conissans]|uniref:Uncharacterized protein n=1 Tax=Pholiota conissans TaxID=109636 RepID=A0A9P5YNJ4_9AGAR|nr:hypothetical protein BDN70DRAFT_938098 [Pholiota conissans]